MIRFPEEKIIRNRCCSVDTAGRQMQTELLDFAKAPFNHIRASALNLNLKSMLRDEMCKVNI